MEGHVAEVPVGILLELIQNVPFLCHMALGGSKIYEKYVVGRNSFLMSY
jgi:hypothetical protein